MSECVCVCVCVALTTRFICHSVRWGGRHCRRGPRHRRTPLTSDGSPPAVRERPDPNKVATVRHKPFSDPVIYTQICSNQKPKRKKGLSRQEPQHQENGRSISRPRGFHIGRPSEMYLGGLPTNRIARPKCHQLSRLRSESPPEFTPDKRQQLAVYL